ncbi:glycoside hydrolase family 5 [Methylobacterium sp. 4-46]|uniref:cellulase family glycosylhydrolase n=1 Tax=unclassified Methylobacterium TaxID=2615210 RepID=UPI000152CE0B|nr:MULTISPECIES: cellulase family glycosylhydrolase [Methylobacterium]ACA16017.1 glycoside hydrolase family 5 [Methylobacterium sp. 4-46]WFT81729.1 cellulase family glycosylhydrolase [Methylobacterium nodulans]
MAAMQLLGVNVTSGDTGRLPGVAGVDYVYPTRWDIDYISSKGMNVIRLPVFWERLQHVPFGALDEAEMAHIDDLVSYATSKGISVVFDLHNFGFGYGYPVGGPITTDSTLADFWGRIAKRYVSNSGIIFGLMNEPQAQPASDWIRSVNSAIQAIRSAGATQEILVPGAYGDSALSWSSTDNATVVGTGVNDPLHNFAFEVHMYFDTNSWGTEPGAISATIGSERLAAVTAWAEANNAQLFLGEFGVGTDQTSLAALDNALSYMEQHAHVWQGGTYWVAGPQLPHPFYSVEPPNPAAHMLAENGSFTFMVNDSSALGQRNILTLDISEDEYQGDAVFSVSVDGVQMGGILTAHASHSSLQSETFSFVGDWGIGQHAVTVNFLNDLYGGASTVDRNLYINYASYDSVPVTGYDQPQIDILQEHREEEHREEVPFPTVSAASYTDIRPGDDTLLLEISEDAWLGSAQYTIAVDGQQIGGKMTATASHGTGQSDVLLINGDWSAGVHKVSIDFLNDNYGGTPAADRNLYLNGATYNGTGIPGSRLTLFSSGSQEFTFMEL